MAVAGRLEPDVQRRVAELSSHLFVDEAHHVSAPTWEAFRRLFLGSRPILQFTATPFRGDGKTIFNYPLRKAQAEGYFKPINFRPVREYRSGHADGAVARA